MQISITARRINITAPFKIIVNEKLAKLKRHNSTIEKARAIFSQEKLNYVSEIILTGKGFRMASLEKEADLRASFDRCLVNLENRLKKFRSRSRERKLKSSHPVLSRARFKKGAGGTGESRIIKIDSFAAKPMSPEEAVLELDLLNREFVVFRNSDSENVNVVYRRKDGNFGLIES